MSNLNIKQPDGLKIRPLRPSQSTRCAICSGSTDLINLVLGKKWVVLCASCSLALVDLLLWRFYPVWGQARCDADTEERLALHLRCSHRALLLWKERHPDSQMWPDGAENICWLVEEVERLEKEVNRLEKERVGEEYTYLG